MRPSFAVCPLPYLFVTITQPPSAVVKRAFGQLRATNHFRSRALYAAAVAAVGGAREVTQNIQVHSRLGDQILPFVHGNECGKRDENKNLG